MTRLQWMKCRLIACVVAVSSAFSQSTVRTSTDGSAIVSKAPASPNLLRDLNSSLEAVISKVSPAVVQIVVTGYGPSEDRGHTDAARIVRQHAIGTGIIVDPDGYIMTNAHVVEGAQRIKVILPPPASDSPIGFQPIHASQILEGRLLGTHKQSDLALLKVDATHLPTVALRSQVRVHQGELVFAIGTPEGLRNTVSMGVVSSLARQLEPDKPMV
jgi:serine protease Do